MEDPPSNSIPIPLQSPPPPAPSAKPTSSTKAPPTIEKSDDLLDPAETAQSGQYVLLVRKAKCYNGKRSLTIHSIVIQSDRLRHFLARFLSGYPGVTLSLHRLEFRAPFEPFVHRWEAFCAALQSEPDDVTYRHADLLHRILDEELHDTIARKKDMVQSKVITHELLWALLEPGVVVDSRTVDGRPRAFEVEAGAYCDHTRGFVVVVAVLAFFVDGVREIVWDAQAFDSLVLPHEYPDLKKLVLRFARAQSRSRSRSSSSNHRTKMASTM
ncbi:uncharacterized protein BP01DRAFT_383905 [Aspergillus saccharolyticus JOP 1030-1]|uniref:Uncharacterized protein n=1 Tax=Aspergillus saccharolyticus JOP 1030-1 TaxID=1450539 RepID=A0A318Z9M4_9EURO|nr:hypothetical protein BP01DRAFT_383905 [Aspergillus saccharolyticus JOP 1030-1]PYH44105.1 hypothetical protein BP01DRAFT_383905 [Aspergillus saccharolyticus JOP 1030-1]